MPTGLHLSVLSVTVPFDMFPCESISVCVVISCKPFQLVYDKILHDNDYEFHEAKFYIRMGGFIVGHSPTLPHFYPTNFSRAEGPRKIRKIKWPKNGLFSLLGGKFRMKKSFL